MAGEACGPDSREDRTSAVPPPSHQPSGAQVTRPDRVSPGFTIRVTTHHPAVSQSGRSLCDSHLDRERLMRCSSKARPPVPRVRVEDTAEARQSRDGLSGTPAVPVMSCCVSESAGRISAANCPRADRISPADLPCHPRCRCHPGTRRQVKGHCLCAAPSTAPDATERRDVSVCRAKMQTSTYYWVVSTVSKRLS